MPFGNPQNGAVPPPAYGGGDNSSASAFYMVKEGKPENLAAATARLFLGARLECAQCHDHPFARWKREQFWGLAAFFAGLRTPQGQGFFGPISEVSDRREITMAGTDRVVQANFLDGSEPRWKYKTGPRTTLADWMTSAENPYFAKAITNRMWAQFFGRGIVNTIDDMHEGNVPSHPEVLQTLAGQFAANGFDLYYLNVMAGPVRRWQFTNAPGYEFLK